MQEHERPEGEEHPEREPTSLSESLEPPPTAAAQPEAAPSTTADQPGQGNQKQYFLGLAWGSIPLLIFLLSGAIARGSESAALSIGLGVLAIGILAYAVLLITAIVFLANKKRRFMGYGLLTMVLVTPVIAVYGCMVIFSYHA